MNFGIIIQARLGSQRLPEKVIAPISGDRSILDIVILRLKQMGLDAPVILATGDPVKNSALEKVAAKNQVHFFSGSEDDVLQRFIDCARHYGLDQVLRVCADNPFLDTGLARQLIDSWSAANYDYASFSVEGKPTILTHYGFFSELVSVDALTRAHAMTSDRSDREHVTRFLYNNPDKFSIKLEEAPAAIKNEKKIRLTVDTKADFKNASLILKQLVSVQGLPSNGGPGRGGPAGAGFDYTYEDVLSAVKETGPEFLNEMQEQIVENSKS